MGSFAMPVHGTAAGGMNMNPTGSFGTITGGSGNYGYGAAANPVANPGSFAPSPTMFPGSSPSAPPVTGGVGAGSATNSQLNNPLGSGIGPQVQTFLNSNGGYNAPLTQQNINAQIAAMQQQIHTGYGDLQSGMGAAGISPNSSAAALESSNYMSNAVAQENAITAQDYFNMWQSSMGNEVSVLESAMGASAQRQQQQYTSAADWLGMGLQGATGIMSANPWGIFGG